ncbi:MAG TPA: acyl-CoA dehydrogenase family protein [Acidimicrobiia bacterium]|nr:acyl-CoA dehydrogenase family protein [Acidimicrobiia bacterium]
MNFAFSEEQEMLRETARRFLESKSPSEVVRRLMETEEGYDESLWAEIAVQGWQAMAIPEEYGGAGFTFMEQAILMEEMGRTLFPSPYLSTVVVGADLILTAGNEDQKQELLPGIASGERTVALAHLEENGSWDADGITMIAKKDGSEIVLDGVKSFVVDGHTADTLIVVVRTDDSSSGEDGISLVVVPGDAAGVTRRRLETMDQTRKQAEITFESVRVPGSAILGSPGGGWSALADTLDRTVVALAFEQVGGAAKCMEMSVQYAKDRVQFGRPIGSFQAIKHKCADMLVEVESAKSAAYYAGWAVAAGDDEVKIVAPLAKSYCSEAFFHCAAETIQIHGGIGFTWEHDAHLYFKRAKTDELLFGSPAHHRAILADRLGI